MGTSPVGKFSTSTPSAAVRVGNVYNGERMRAGRRGTHAECWQGANLSDAHYHIPTACGASTHLEGVATGPRVAELPMLLLPLPVDSERAMEAPDEPAADTSPLPRPAPAPPTDHQGVAAHSV